MALEITNIWAVAKSGNPLLVGNVSPASITGLGKTQLTTGTVVDLVANESVTVNSNTSGRAFVSHSLTFSANKSYLVMARFSNVVLGGTAAINRMCLRSTAGTNITYGTNSRVVTGDGLYAFVVQHSVETAAIIRAGAGTDSGITGSSANISDLCVYRIPSFIDVNGAIPPPLGAYTSLVRRGLAFATQFANTYASTGLVTEAAMAVPLAGAKEKYRVGCYVSDSFGNDTGDWPDYLSSTYGYALFGGSWPGMTMSYFNAHAADVFSRTGVGFIGDALPDFAICQSSLNSANQGHTSATMLSDMTGLITKALAAGLKPFVTNMTPYGPTMSGAEQTELLAYNAALPALCASLGAVHIDVYTLVSNPADRSVLIAGYTTDQIHLSATGVAVYADAVNAAIVLTRLAASVRKPLASNPVRQLIRSPIH